LNGHEERGGTADTGDGEDIKTRGQRGSAEGVGKLIVCSGA
jgi:hypothetical protein